MKRLRKIKDREREKLNSGDQVLISTTKDNQLLWLRGWVSQNQQCDNGKIAVLKYSHSKNNFWMRWTAHNSLKRVSRLDERGSTHPFILNGETPSNLYLVKATEVPDLFKELQTRGQLKQATYPYDLDQPIVYHCVSSKPNVAFTHGYFQAKNFCGGVYRHQVDIVGEDGKFSTHVDPFTNEVIGVVLEEPETITKVGPSKEGRKIEGIVEEKLQLSSEDYNLDRETYLGPIEANAVYMRGIEEFNRGVALLNLEDKIGVTIQAISRRSRPIKPKDPPIYNLWD